MNRTIEDDAAKLCGTPPHNSPANLCYGDAYFDADCRRMWGESAWTAACRNARPQPVPTLPPAPPPPPKRNAYTTTRNAWGMGVTHTCDACAQTFRGEHSAAWHECPGKAAGWPYSDATATPAPGSPEDPFFARGGTTTGRLTDQRGSMVEIDRRPTTTARIGCCEENASNVPKADLLSMDFRHLEERVVASLGDFDEAAAFGLAQWVALGYAPYTSAMLCPATGRRCQTTGRCSEPAGCLRKRAAPCCDEGCTFYGMAGKCYPRAMGCTFVADVPERCPWDDFKPAREVA